MDKLLGVHERKAAKQKNSKRNPIKVVYISNPMMVKTNASDFRALVQELTGQGSDLENPTKRSEIDDVGEILTDVVKINDNGSRNDTAEPINNKLEIPFEPFDEVFTPEMIDNLTGLLPSSLAYDSVELHGSSGL